MMRWLRSKVRKVTGASVKVKVHSPSVNDGPMFVHIPKTMAVALRFPNRLDFTGMEDASFECCVFGRHSSFGNRIYFESCYFGKGAIFGKDSFFVGCKWEDPRDQEKLTAGFLHGC